MSNVNRNILTDVFVQDFSGGQASAKSHVGLDLNEFLEASNIIVYPGNKGFRSKPGCTAHNASAISTGDAITGLGYFRTSSLVEYLVAISGISFEVDAGLTGTFVEPSGSATVTSGQNNLWDFVTYNDLAIGIGGAPNAPIKFDGTTLSALGGSPPSADFGFIYNNRLWLGVASTSTIYWSALANAEDFTTSGESGTGNAEIEKKDGDTLVGGRALNLNTIILFKQNSTHLVTGRVSPFSTFRLFDVGCCGKSAHVNVDGLVYFITPQKRMLITDGSHLIDNKELPQLNNIDDMWDGVNSDRLKYIRGTVVKGKDFHWIIWSVTYGTGTQNNYGFIWDLLNKCWLIAPTGLGSNAFALAQDGRSLYKGGYDSVVYKCLVEDTYTEADNSDEPVEWTVTSGLVNINSILKTIQVQKLAPVFRASSNGTVTVKWGYDTELLPNSKSLSFVAPGTGRYGTSLYGTGVYAVTRPLSRAVFALGRGNYFQWQMSGNVEASYESQGISLYGTQRTVKEQNTR